MTEGLDQLRDALRNSGSGRSACSAVGPEGTALVLTVVFEIDSAELAELTGALFRRGGWRSIRVEHNSNAPSFDGLPGS